VTMIRRRAHENEQDADLKYPRNLLHCCGPQSSRFLG